MRNETRRLWVKYNCHPAKAFLLPWFQIPLWIGLSYALRNLCAGWAHNAGQIPREDFYHGGFAWFENMAVPDKTWTLPLCYGFTNLLLCELWVAGIKQRTTLMKMAIWISRLVSVIFVPIAGALPAVSGRLIGFTPIRLERLFAWNCVKRTAQAARKISSRVATVHYQGGPFAWLYAFQLYAYHTFPFTEMYSSFWHFDFVGCFILLVYFVFVWLGPVLTANEPKDTSFVEDSTSRRSEITVSWAVCPAAA